jgi:hypothetical protein
MGGGSSQRLRSSIRRLGQRGSTNVRLAAADETTIQSAVAMAWQNKAPKQLVKN